MSDSGADRFAFLDLAEDFFRELHVQPPPPRTFDDRSPVTLHLDVEGQAFGLTHDPEADGEHIVVECRFGGMPAEVAEPALGRLLEANALLDPHGSTAFGIDEQSGEVLCVRRDALGGASARTLLDELHAMARLAATWQQTWFIDPPEPHDGRRAAP
jgi:hypothetical protein